MFVMNISSYMPSSLSYKQHYLRFREYDIFHVVAEWPSMQIYPAHIVLYSKIARRRGVSVLLPSVRDADININMHS